MRADAYSIAYPADGVEPETFRARRSDTRMSPVSHLRSPTRRPTPRETSTPPVDPWHQADNLVTGGRDEYNGMDNFFTSGLTMGHAALVACAAIYDTPEDCANEVAYIHKRGYPVVGIEIGEECDGKHTMPEDYGAHLLPMGDGHSQTRSRR